MANRASIPRGTSRIFRAAIDGAAGTETMKLVVAAANPTSYDAAGSLVRSLIWDASTSTFFCVLTATDTQSLTVGNYYACVWRTDSSSEDVPIAPGQFVVTDTPRAS